MICLFFMFVSGYFLDFGNFMSWWVWVVKNGRVWMILGVFLCGRLVCIIL